MAAAHLITSLNESALTASLRFALYIYAASLMAMLTFSALWNTCAWNREYRRTLQLLDHVGILCLTCGSYSPMLVASGFPRLLALDWTIAAVSTAIKASGSRLDTLAIHIPLFLLLGWSAAVVWTPFWAHFSPWAKAQCMLTGMLYSTGLLPWACNRIEFHNALWHVFVLLASASFYTVVLFEVSRPTDEAVLLHTAPM